MKKNNKTKIEISNRLAISIVACMTILFTISLGFAYGTSNPQAFGHSTGELEKGTMGCINMNTSIDPIVTISLLVDGTNICETPHGCKIFMSILTGEQTRFLDISSGIFIQQGSGNYYSDIIQQRNGMNGAFPSSIIGALIPQDPNLGCTLKDDDHISTSFSKDEIFLEDHYPSEMGIHCGVTICSRE